MGNVNPGYNLLCKLVTRDGLAVVGSHFPGSPGIIVGRNRDCGWGMVGLMADNQDLLVGELETLRLERTISMIEVRGREPIEHVAHGFAHGRMLAQREGRGLFLRWPALDAPVGGVSLTELARSTDWDSWRAGLARMTNAPMLAVYADRAGHIGMHAVGLIPKRRREVGSLVLPLADPASAWDGYVPFGELPHAFDPPDGWVAYANQYSTRLFGARPHVSNRWHPPTRAWRLAELLAGTPRHDAASACRIQDDRVDRFARDNLPFLRGLLAMPTALDRWSGDTRDTGAALLFDRWMAALVDEVTRTALPPALASRYPDMWPGHRWNVLAILRDHARQWQLDPHATLLRAYLRATATSDAPVVELRHTLRRHPIAKLAFGVRYRYDGGTRETIHVARRNTDFLTASQEGKGDGAFHFGPAFKLVYDFADGTTRYLSNTPASGLPFGFALAPTLRRWLRGRRYVTRLP
jgi:penicillin amidase